MDDIRRVITVLSESDLKETENEMSNKGKYNTSKLNNLDQYKDKNKVDKYAIDGMKWAVGNEIIHGKDSVTLDPTNNATRGETAIMIMNYCKSIFGWK